MQNKKIKSDKGIVVADALVSVLLILLFGGLIVTIISTIVNETTKVKFNSTHIELETEVFEYVQKLSYEQTTDERIINYLNKKYSNDTDYISFGNSTDDLTTPCKVAIKVEQYGKDDGKLDLIKIITISIENTSSDEQYKTEVSTLKKRTEAEVDDLLS